MPHRGIVEMDTFQSPVAISQEEYFCTPDFSAFVGLFTQSFKTFLYTVLFQLCKVAVPQSIFRCNICPTIFVLRCNIFGAIFWFAIFCLWGAVFLVQLQYSCPLVGGGALGILGCHDLWLATIACDLWPMSSFDMIDYTDDEEEDDDDGADNINGDYWLWFWQMAKRQS